MNRRTFLRSATAAIASGTIAPALLPAAILDAPAPAQPAAAPGENLPSRHSLITVVIYDERYRDCRLFADALVARGAVAFATRGDSAALWYGPLRAHLARYEPLDPHHARYPAQHGAHNTCIVAGFTTEADRHVSQSCGRELTLALLYEGVHDSRRAPGHAPNRVTTVAHRLRAVSNEAEIAAALSSSRELASLISDSRDPAWRESPSGDSSPPRAPMHLAMPSSQSAAVTSASPSWPASLAEALCRIAPAHAQSRIAPGASVHAPVSALTPRSPDYPGYLTSWLLASAAA